MAELRLEAFESANDALATLHRSLIAETLRNARRVPYYRDSWNERFGDSAPTSLTDIPFTFKADLEKAGRRAQLWDGQICQEKFTSGTTGTPFVYVIGKREQSVLRRFYEAQHSEEPKPMLRRAVRFHDTHVTFERPIPVPIRFHELSIYGVGSFEYARSVLRARHEEDGVEADCTILVAGERILRAFTDSTRELHPDGFPSPLRFVFTYSTYVTERARREYESIWGATVIDRYGLAESVGGATEDGLGWYLFDPVVVPEVVGIHSLAPVGEGLGMLVLTPLFPFQEAQPLIRYWTDDVVEVTHSRSSIPGRLAIRPLGRRALGVPAPAGDAWYLTPDVVFDVLDARPDVARSPLFGDSPQVLDPYAAGLPRCRLTVAETKVGLEAVLGVHLNAPVASHSKILDDIGCELLARSTSLQRACQHGDCTFRVTHLDDV